MRWVPTRLKPANLRAFACREHVIECPASADFGEHCGCADRHDDRCPHCVTATA